MVRSIKLLSSEDIQGSNPKSFDYFGGRLQFTITWLVTASKSMRFYAVPRHSRSQYHTNRSFRVCIWPQQLRAWPFLHTHSAVMNWKAKAFSVVTGFRDQTEHFRVLRLQKKMLFVHAIFCYLLSVPNRNRTMLSPKCNIQLSTEFQNFYTVHQWVLSVWSNRFAKYTSFMVSIFGNILSVTKMRQISRG